MVAINIKSGAHPFIPFTAVAAQLLPRKPEMAFDGQKARLILTE